MLSPTAFRCFLQAIAIPYPTMRKILRRFSKKTFQVLGTDRGLLAAYLFARIWLLADAFGQASGWDTGAHMEMLTAWPWSERFWDIRSAFYAYHPPLAFLLPRILMTMGLPDVQSVQIIAALATLASFFCIRSLLKHLDLLTKPIELAFLYITFSLPFLIYLSHAVTMDVLILLAACGALLHGWKFSDAKTERQRLLHGLLSVFWLMFALYAKYNGVLLLPLPLLIAGCSGRGKRLRRLAEAACMVAAAIALAFPWYYGRTYVQEGQFFVSNMDMEEYDKQALAGERAHRDQNPEAFWRAYFGSPPPEAQGVDRRDQGALRILNTWKDFWASSHVPHTPLSLLLSTAYMYLGGILIMIGCVHFACTVRWNTPWDRLGFVLGILFLLHFIALAAYSWQYPHAVGFVNKGVYIAPVILALGYFSVRPLILIPLEHHKKSWRRLLDISCIPFLGLFVLINHLIPVH